MKQKTILKSTIATRMTCQICFVIACWSSFFIFAQGVTSNDQWTLISKQDAMGTMMVQVPAGSFTMGSNQTEIDYTLQLCNGEQTPTNTDGECENFWFDDERKAGTKTLKEAFWIDETEVTRAAYQVCVNEGVCSEPPANEYSTSDTQPINNVIWYQAAKYCIWRGARLPTDVEWEYAARGPDGLMFPWGNRVVGNEANHCDSNCTNAPWASSFTYINPDHDDGFAVTSPVGSYPESASWVGALDMAGNVWEWTGSQHQDYPFDEEIVFTGNEKFVSGNISLRGGAFDVSSVDLRSARRVPVTADHLDFVIGFRCARADADF